MRPFQHDLPGPGTTLPDLARIVRSVRQGHVNATGEVVLATGTTTTTVRSLEFGPGTVLVLVPTTSTGAALSRWQASRIKGGIVIGHAAPGSDQTFLWVALG